MKKLILLITVFLCACQPATPAATPTPTPEPSCTKDFCIQDVYLSLSESNILMIQIAMTDVDGTVPIGFDAIPEDAVLAALYLAEEDPDFYLVGFKLEPAGLACYTGNDLPWSDGSLGRVCSLTLAASSLAKQIKVGNDILVELDMIPSLKPTFNRSAIWLEP